MSTSSHYIKQSDELNPDVNFEQNFARIAFTTITDRVPSITKHTLGFELLDRGENDEKAFGVFAIRIKDIIGFIPVILTDGHIKGSNLLFIKDENIFVPFNEDWVNFLKFSPEVFLGHPIHKNDRPTVSEPDLRKLIVPPTHNKMGAVKRAEPEVELTLQDRDSFLSTIFQNVNFNDHILPGLLKHASVREALRSYGQKYASFAHAYQYFYGQTLEDALREAEKTAQYRQLFKPYQKNETQDVTVRIHPNDKITFITQEKAAEIKAVLNVPFTEKEKTELIKKGYIVKDARDPKEITMIVNEAPETFIKVTEPGVYEVLMDDNTWKKLIILPCKSNKSSYLRRYWFIIDPETETITQYPTICPEDISIFTCKAETYKTNNGEAPETFKKWFEKLPKITEKTNLSLESSDIALVTDDMEVVLPEYDTVITTIPENFSQTKPIYIIKNIIYINPDRVRIAQIDRKNKPKFTGTESPQHQSTWVIDLGGKRTASKKTAETWLRQHYGHLKIAKDGLEVWVNNQSFSPIEAVIHLVKTHGLSEKDASSLVKKAMTQRSEVVRVTVKYGEDYPYLTPGPNAPPFPQFEYPSLADRLGTYDINPRLVVSLLADDVKNYRDHDPTKYLPYPEYMEDPLAAQMAQIAQRTGLKTIFDTSAIYAIIKQPLSKEMIRELSVRTIETMTKIAVMLIHIWWHKEEVENKFYGKNKIAEIEIDLQNCFDGLGKLVLEIKKLSK